MDEELEVRGCGGRTVPLTGGPGRAEKEEVDAAGAVVRGAAGPGTRRFTNSGSLFVRWGGGCAAMFIWGGASQYAARHSRGAGEVMKLPVAD